MGNGYFSRYVSLQEEASRTLEQVSRSERPSVRDASSREIVWDIFPSWAYDLRVQELGQQDEFKNELLPMGLCTGPAVPLVRCGIIVLWFSLICITAISFHFSRCTDKKMAYSPIWIWSLWLPAFAFCSYIEFQCVKLTIVPYSQVVRNFKFFRFKVPFSCWLPLTCALSSLQRLDVACDGLFTATALANPNCKSDNEQSADTDRVWHYVLQKSLWHYVHFDHIPFKYVIILSYLLMFVQVIYALITTTPWGSHPDYVVGNKKADGTKADVQFRNLVGGVMNFGDSLHVLGEPMGCATLTLQKPSYPEMKAFILLEQREVPASDKMRAVSFVKNTLEHGIILLGTVALLENALQANIQVTMFALKRATAKDNLWQWHWVVGLLSIALSLIMTAEKIRLGWDFTKFAQRVFDKIRELDALCEPRDPETQCGSNSAEEGNVFRPSHRARFGLMITDANILEVAVRYNRILKLITCLLVISLVYAVAKFTAVFYCKDSLWNVTGCVDLGDDFHSRSL